MKIVLCSLLSEPSFYWADSGTRAMVAVGRRHRRRDFVVRLVPRLSNLLFEQATARWYLLSWREAILFPSLKAVLYFEYLLIRLWSPGRPRPTPSIWCRLPSRGGRLRTITNGDSRNARSSFSGPSPWRVARRSSI